MTTVRRANPGIDAKQITELLDICNLERVTLVDPLTAEQESAYLRSLAPRAAVFVAYDADKFLGFQSCSEYCSYSLKLKHVVEIGTWIMPESRRKGVGRKLWQEGSLPFLLEKGFTRAVITVIAYNTPAVRFYQSLGFTVCGRLSKHIRFPDRPHELVDELIMELNL